MNVEQMTVADFVAIKHDVEAYWGPLDEPRATVVRTLHHPLFIHEFGETALLVRDETRSIAAYLLGLVVTRPAVGYIHLIGVRQNQRRLGLARLLYETFESWRASLGRLL